MKKLLILTVFLPLLAITGCTRETKRTSETPAVIPPQQEENNAEPLIGGDKDEHGCLGPAGYQWCEVKNKCLRIWEEACYAGAEQEIQYRLAQKYNKPAADVTVTATKKSADYMVGKVSFAAKGLPAGGAGGLFLAARQGNMWELVYDGNGSIDCESIKLDYQFPADMLAGFCD
ncbi:MAG: hypothetical protein WCV70_02215 [Patescibacteria group bacterium]|jgi:hypothetical protein